MKQKDIILIAIIVIVSAVISLFASKALFGSPKAANKQAEVVSPITADFPEPDTRYFNNQSIDPTKSITVQQNANANPFNGTGN